MTSLLAASVRTAVLTGAAALLSMSVIGCSSSPDLPTAPPIESVGVSSPPSDSPMTGASASKAATDPLVPSADPRPTATGLPASPPTTVSIPSLDVQTSLVRLGLDPEGAMEIPQGAQPVGWFTGSPTPGEIGPTVLAGHVTWNGKRGVFFSLGEMKQGEKISLTRKDGKTVRYEVTKVATYSKSDFPTLTVYGNTSGPELRLITCAGDYHPGADQPYAANVVVFARAW